MRTKPLARKGKGTTASKSTKPDVPRTETEKLSKEKKRLASNALEKAKSKALKAPKSKKPRSRVEDVERAKKKRRLEEAEDQRCFNERFKSAYNRVIERIAQCTQGRKVDDDQKLGQILMILSRSQTSLFMMAGRQTNASSGGDMKCLKAN
nr:hypothetical protein Itr_chr06CG15480 [Ipomoea trifida]GMD03947.1 hypothetical protein Iba_chr06aCG13770 [Ipomoea batatas]